MESVSADRAAGMSLGLRWRVACVVLYAAAMMLSSALRAGPPRPAAEPVVVRIPARLPGMGE